MSCTNPFAPKLAEGENDDPLISDQTTIEGVFENFRYAYIFKDTVVYGNLLADDFTFVYRDYDQGVDVSWGRQEDMISTLRMFNATQSLDIIWNEVIVSIGDTIVQDISRGFNLTVVFNPTDIIRVQGRAIMRLKRLNQKSPWKIIMWRDESNF